jgi:hypothetical protein
MMEFQAVPGGFNPSVGSLHSWTAKKLAKVIACEYRPPFTFEGKEYPGGFLYIDEDGVHKAASAEDFTAKYGNVR